MTHPTTQTPTIVPIETPTLGDRSYLVHDGEVAFVVDPQRGRADLTAGRRHLLRHRRPAPDPSGPVAPCRHLGRHRRRGGLLTGLFGVGGGFLIIPALTLLLGLPMVTATATSLVIIILNSAAGFTAHLSDAPLNIGLAAAFTGAAVAGSLAAGHVAPLVVVAVRGLVAMAPQHLTSRVKRAHEPGFSNGNKIVSRIPAPVNNITSRSIPNPSPPIGGAPNSSAARKSSSSCIASTSPAAAASDCAVNRSRWITGSISSENPVPRSSPPMIRSHASIRSGSLRCGRASGCADGG